MKLSFRSFKMKTVPEMVANCVCAINAGVSAWVVQTVNLMLYLFYQFFFKGKSQNATLLAGWVYDLCVAS